MPVGPVIVSIVFFATIGIVIGAAIFTRHRERMALIEKGAGADVVRSLYQKPTYGGEPLGALKWGMILVGIGLGAFIGVWLNEYYMSEDGVIPGMIILCAGLALVLFYFIAARRVRKHAGS